MKTKIFPAATLLMLAAVLPVKGQTANPQPPAPTNDSTTAADWLKRLDLNGDGIVSESEFMQYQISTGTQPGSSFNSTASPTSPTPSTPTGTTNTTNTTDASANFRALDTNGDGVLSAEEFANAPSLIGTPPPSATGTGATTTPTQTPAPVTPAPVNPAPVTPAPVTPTPPKSAQPSTTTVNGSANLQGTVNTNGTPNRAIRGNSNSNNRGANNGNQRANGGVSAGVGVRASGNAPEAVGNKPGASVGAKVGK